MKNIVAQILTVLVLGGFAQSAVAADDIEVKFVPGDLNAIQFTDKMWSEEFWGMDQKPLLFIDEKADFGIAAPPANDSPETKAELEVLLKYQRDNRLPETVEAIKAEHRKPGGMHFGLGEKIDPNVLMKVSEARSLANSEMDFFLYRLKKEHKRARPTQLAANLTTVVDIPAGAAYPSGHAGVARLGARVFGYIDPKNAEKYLLYADGVALRRQIAGIHYPRDCSSAQELADKVFEALIATPEYKKIIDGAKREYILSQNNINTAAINDINFPDDAWDPHLLEVIEKGPHFLKKEIQFTLPDFPANDSPQTRDEIEHLRELQKSDRTQEQLDRILDEDGRSTNLLEGGALIDQFKDNNAFNDLWAKAYTDVTYVLMVMKKKYDRARPTQLAPDLQTEVPMPGHPSYPSGHTAQTRIIARMLGEIDPQNAQAYKDMAARIGRRRETAGLHYPTDTSAGKMLADQIFDELMKVPEFQQQMEKAKAEFSARNTH